MSIQLSGELPPKAREALGVLTESLATMNGDKHVIVATVTGKKVVTTSHPHPRTSVTAGIVDLEAFPMHSPEWEAGMALLERGRQQRTGEVPLPLYE